MNSCDFTGRLTKDPELRKNSNDKDVVYFSLAVDSKFRKNQANFLNFQIFGKAAEYLVKFGKKGMYVEIENAEASSYAKDKVTYTTFTPQSIKLIFANSKKVEEIEEEKEEEIYESKENIDKKEEKTKPLF